MNILYDYQIFHYQRFGGISRYFVELMNSLRTTQLVNIQLPLKWSANKEINRLLPFLGKVRKYPPLSERLHVPGSGKLQSLYYSVFPSRNRELVQQQFVLQALKEKRVDVFHPTYFEDYYTPYIAHTPLVVTVFDMIYELFPEYFPKESARALIEKRKKVVLQAKSIIAISESTKNDLCRLYGINSNKVIVIPLANSLTCELSFVDSRFTKELPEQYLLFVGTRTGYKNYQFFLFSIIDILNTYQNLFLICTGSPFTEDENKLHKAYGLENRILYMEAHLDVSLSALYKNARALVYPSLYEGFGLPILEAMHFGCPVIVSNTSSCPEVAGEAALYIDPRNADSIRSTLSRLLESEALRTELREKGREQEKKYSWNKVAEQTFEVYKTV